METKPLIAVTVSSVVAKTGFPALALNRNYAEGIVRSGGNPVAYAHPELAEDYADMAQGLLMIGGVDIHPHLYGQPPIDAPEHYDRERDKAEMELARLFMQQKKPILCICRGFQLLNAMLGGALNQDIPTWCGARHSGGCRHMVNILPGTFLSEHFGPDLEVNSYHHQAIAEGQLSPELKPAAVWSQGDAVIIEAYEHPTLPIRGVQWHPERMLGDESGDMSVLFQWLVDEAK